MKRLIIAIGIIGASVSYAQTAKKIPNRALDQDLCLEVNDGGTPTIGLCVDGGTALVGVGTDEPIRALHVKGTGSTNYIRLESLTWQGLEFSDGTNIWTIGQDDSDRFTIANAAGFGGGPNRKFIINQAGHLGMGTLSPQDEVHFDDENDSQVAIRLTNATTGKTASDGGRIMQSGLQMLIRNMEDGEVRIDNDGGARRITAATGGNVGVGSIALPREKLEIHDDNPSILIFDGADITANGLDLGGINFGGEKSPGVGVHTNAARIDVEASSTGTWSSTSGNNFAGSKMNFYIQDNSTTDRTAPGQEKLVLNQSSQMTLKGFASPKFIISDNTSPGIAFDRPAGSSFVMENTGGALNILNGTPGYTNATDIKVQLTGTRFAHLNVISNVGTGSAAQVSGGFFTVQANSGSFITIDTEGGAATDNLDNIVYNGSMGPIANGDILYLRSVSGARDTTVKDGTGNMQLAGDFVLTSSNDSMQLIYNTASAKWIEVSRSNNE